MSGEWVGGGVKMVCPLRPTLSSPTPSPLPSYVLDTEQWGVELFQGLLSAHRPALLKSGVSYVTASNIASYPPAKGKRVRVMDFGANHGFYGVFAARLGWNTVAVDPQPHCAHYVAVAGAASGVSDRLTVINGFLGKHGKTTDGATSLAVPLRTGCWGTWPLQGRGEVEAHYSQFPGSLNNTQVPVVDPLSIVNVDTDMVLVMKIDVEGVRGGWGGVWHPRASASVNIPVSPPPPAPATHSLMWSSCTPWSPRSRRARSSTF